MVVGEGLVPSRRTGDHKGLPYESQNTIAGSDRFVGIIAVLTLNLCYLTTYRVKHSPSATIYSPSATIYSPSATIYSPSATIYSPSATIYSPSGTKDSPSASSDSPSATKDLIEHSTWEVFAGTRLIEQRNRHKGNGVRENDKK